MNRQPEPTEQVYAISPWKAAGAIALTVFLAAFTIWAGLDWSDDGSINPWVLGLGLLAGAYLIPKEIKDARTRPELHLNKLGLTWDGHFHSWQQIRTYKGTWSRHNRFICIDFEPGTPHPVPLAVGPLRPKKDSQELGGLNVDVTWFEASNNKIEDAMDDFFFPARGMERSTKE